MSRKLKYMKLDKFEALPVEAAYKLRTLRIRTVEEFLSRTYEITDREALRKYLDITPNLMEYLVLEAGYLTGFNPDDKRNVSFGALYFDRTTFNKS